MTIAIGLIASDGIVLAADREESDAYQKLDQGKLRGKSIDFPPYDTVVIAGAGSGAYIDAITLQALNWFARSLPVNISDVEKELAQQNKDFYTEHVLPLALYPSEERPDYSLLIGAKIGPTRVLWTTDALVMNPRDGYAAVGIGATTARALLQKFYAYVPTVSAINLAVYIIGEVKRLVQGCGLDTDVLYACAGGPGKVVGDEVREIEDGLRGFGRVLERANFHRYIGSDLSNDPRTKADEVTKQTGKIESVFRGINERRSKTLHPTN